MPANGPEKTTNSSGRTTFRPPWVKEGPQPVPMPTPPWTKSKLTPASQDAGATSAAPSKAPSTTTMRINGMMPNQPVREVKLQSREIKVPIMTERKRPLQEPLKPREKPVVVEVEEEKPKVAKPQERPVTVVKKKEVKEEEKEVPVKSPMKALKKVPPPVEKPKEEPKVIKPTLKKVVKDEEKPSSNVPLPPPPPPMAGPPPPPPPPPSNLAPPPDFERKPLTDKHKKTLEKLKQRPRRRPDWSDMMQEVEQGRKLRHVECNDRSKPILKSKTMTKVAGQFVFETEKANVHNILLKQIQGGVRLKPTKCNDRSKPILAGLRKFRRQMTIEEQIQKSESRAQMAEVPPDEESEDEMDDIDKLRDDLQSTKQMLNLELRSKEAQERENKRLLARIQILEAELDREKQHRSSSTGSSSNSSVSDEPLVKSLKKDAEEAQKTSKILEKKYQEAAEQLDTAKNEIEEHKRQIQVLEKKLSQVVQGQILETNTRRNSEAPAKESSPEPETESSESDSDDDDEKKAERAARRLERDVKILRSKLTKFKEKLKMAKKERENLRQSMKSNQSTLKQENKKYKKLQREVDKMAALMKEDSEEEDSEKEEEEAEEEEEEEEESSEEEETETEESEEEESESESESEPETAPNEDKQTNLEPRVKRHEGRLSALKKGNYLLQANVDRLQDEITKIREKSSTLQRDLDSVLSELG